jgi:hypothetical protein
MGRQGGEGKDSEGGPAGDIPPRQRSMVKDQGKGNTGMETLRAYGLIRIGNKGTYERGLIKLKHSKRYSPTETWSRTRLDLRGAMTTRATWNSGFTRWRALADKA